MSLTSATHLAFPETPNLPAYQQVLPEQDLTERIPISLRNFHPAEGDDGTRVTEIVVRQYHSDDGIAVSKM